MSKYAISVSPVLRKKLMNFSHDRNDILFLSSLFYFRNRFDRVILNTRFNCISVSSFTHAYTIIIYTVIYINNIY